MECQFEKRGLNCVLRGDRETKEREKEKMHWIQKEEYLINACREIYF